jgi:hypothetical protein
MMGGTTNTSFVANMNGERGEGRGQGAVVVRVSTRMCGLALACSCASVQHAEPQHGYGRDGLAGSDRPKHAHHRLPLGVGGCP